MNILHTEASTGWGGQEIRILSEAKGMRDRGHEVIFAVNLGGKLAEEARRAGFLVYEFSMSRKGAVLSLWRFAQIIRRHHIDIVNTHSSLDAWLGGIAARLTKRKVVRTRHLSTEIRAGINSRLLYGWLADRTVTTCQEVAHKIRRQALLSDFRCSSIPTGVDPNKLSVEEEAAEKFRRSWGVCATDFVIGTVCMLRSWKGIFDFLQAAKLLEDRKDFKWLIVGSGPSEHKFQAEWKRLGLEEKVVFTGHLENPFPAMAALDVFALLSTAHEGVSQASLQAAYLQKPLITTTIGGLPEVCLHGKTGFHVDVGSPQGVCEALTKLAKDKAMREQMGKAARELVLDKFTMNKTLDEMEEVYRGCLVKS